MSETKRIKTALVSVYHKEGLDEIITHYFNTQIHV
ncbi:iMP cyclohydrolase phosphoribosylaminoimidazolecarboxamide formyltransferase [Bacteroides eggerthii CAG:109]|nr:iMP cyclohydrolase phosphoribosylaminoimidazolecarboxamide formyltransferase [Bacteroides eggerthii CAG:109]